MFKDTTFGLLCLLLCFSLLHSFSRKYPEFSSKIRLNNEGQFIDNFGRVKMFHGFNSIEKSIPWYNDQILNDTKLKLYKEWGFNLVRLGSMWSGFQPTQTNYNDTYINIMVQIVRKLRKYGLYTLLDMHQDLLSSKFRSYDGIPLWLMNTFPNVSESLKFPFPLKKNGTYFWSDYYITYEVANAFQNLYTTEIGLESWENIWAKIGSIFSKEVSVIGYELINEPWVGNFYKDPQRLLPGYAGRYNLLPAYDNLVRAIREVDQNTLVFYEPVTFGAYLPSVGGFGTGFHRVPGGKTQKLKSVLSYHYYCFFLTTSDPSKKYPFWKKILCDNFLSKRLFSSVRSDIKFTGGGSLLTEFGGCIPDGNEKSINTIECDWVLKLADQYYQSYTYWDSKFFDDQGNVNEAVIKSFARAYPRAVQGRPLKYTFNKDTGLMTLIYVIDLNIKAATEIFLPITIHYKSGFKNETNPKMHTIFVSETYTFLVIAPPKVKQGSMVTISVYPNYR